MISDKITLTIPEVAQILRIGRSCAYNLAKKPGFPVIKIDCQLRVPTELLEEWIKRQAFVS